MSLARVFGCQLHSLAPPVVKSAHSLSSRSATIVSSTSTLATSTSPATGTSNSAAAPRILRKLTPSEMQEHRRLGLCYNCDEKYSRQHRCQQIFSIIITNDEEINEPTPESMEMLQISLHALTGIRMSETMQVRATVGSMDVTALLDLGSMHNFIFGGEVFITDLYAIALGGYDVVLGTQWLAALGPILWDFM